MNKNKNIGTITLCGLIIGPILGSGIVLLPPLAYSLIGSWSIFAWIIIMIMGAIFAYVFIFLSLKSPGNEGVAIAVKKSLGGFWSEITSNFITTAVCFGPVAVLITAASFLKNFSIFSNMRVETIEILLEIICAFILISGIKTFSKITLILTSLTAVILFSGSLYTLLFASNIHLSQTPFSFSKFGYTLLLLFWAITGWEVVGNYIEDIVNPKKTLIKSMTISLIVIISLYMFVAFSIQNTVSQKYNIMAIMTPLFGSFAVTIICIIAPGLCICTYLMIIGGVSRMTAKRAQNNKLPSYLAYLNKNGSPVNAIITLVAIHFFIILLLITGILSLDKLVTCANVFFLSNAIIGLAAGFKLLDDIKLRIPIAILIMCFILLIFKAELWSIILLILITLLSIVSYYRNQSNNLHQKLDV